MLLDSQVLLVMVQACEKSSCPGRQKVPSTQGACYYCTMPLQAHPATHKGVQPASGAGCQSGFNDIIKPFCWGARRSSAVQTRVDSLVSCVNQGSLVCPYKFLTRELDTLSAWQPGLPRAYAISLWDAGRSQDR